MSRRLAPVLEPEREGVWYSRYAWWTVYPLGWDDPGSGPDGALKEVQTPLVGELFWAVMDDIGARRIVLVAGKDWWPEVRGLLDQAELREGERPILAAGRSRGRQIVATYHPRGARQQGIRDEQLVAAIAGAFARDRQHRSSFEWLKRSRSAGLEARHDQLSSSSSGGDQLLGRGA